MADRTLRMEKEREKARLARELRSFEMLKRERTAAPEIDGLALDNTG